MKGMGKFAMKKSAAKAAKPALAAKPAKPAAAAKPAKKASPAKQPTFVDQISGFQNEAETKRLGLREENDAALREQKLTGAPIASEKTKNASGQFKLPKVPKGPRLK